MSQDGPEGDPAHVLEGGDQGHKHGLRDRRGRVGGQRVNDVLAVAGDSGESIHQQTTSSSHKYPNCLSE